MKSLDTVFFPSFTFLIVASPTSTATSCYFPSGKPSADPPCDPDAPFSMCCPSPAYCLSNGLCLQPSDDPSPNVNISYARGSCTDPSWESSVCPRFCFANQDRDTNSLLEDSGSGEQVWECGSPVGYSLPATYCCQSEYLELDGTRCCNTPSALFELGAATIGNPSTSTSTSRSSSSRSMPSNVRSTSNLRLPSLLSHTTPSVALPPKSLITTHLATSIPSITLSLTSSLTSSSTAPILSSSHGKTPLVSIIGAVLGGLAFLGMAIGGLWIWNERRRTARQTGSPEWRKPELPANAVLSTPFHRGRVYEIQGDGKPTPELPAPSRHELIGNDGAREMPTLD